MKNRRIFVLLIAALSIVSFTLTSCEETEPAETCGQDEICPGKNVTTCCDATACIYKYDGKEYTADEEDQLADDLGCTSGGARVAAEEREQLINQLQSIMSRVKARVK